MASKKTAEAETKLRAMLAAREIDGIETSEVAALLGVSQGIALRLMTKFSDEDFVADDGSTLHYNELETKRGPRRGSGLSDRQPRTYVWFFT